MFDALRERCELCGSSAISLYHTDWRGNQIFRCADCNIQFQNPQYSADYLTEYYSSYTQPRKHLAPGTDASHRYHLDWLNRYADQPGKLLDVGCGKGELMVLAQDQGWQAEGYDVDPATTAVTAERIGMPVYSGEFDQVDFTGKSYDALVMIHVIEHLKSPHPYFRVFDSILKPGGLLMVAAPNLASPSARFKHWLEQRGWRKKLVGDYYDTDHHLWYYSRASLKHLLDQYGYDVLHARGDRGARKLSTPWRRFKRSLLSFMEPLLWSSAMMVVARKRG